jgi:hypothetical protein
MLDCEVQYQPEQVNSARIEMMKKISDEYNVQKSIETTQWQLVLDAVKQRGQFQRQCVLLNIASIGGIASFALSNPNRVSVLFAIPAISFLLFCFWFHNALVILDVELFVSQIESERYHQGKSIGRFQNGLLKFSYAAGQVSHFGIAGLLVLWYLRSDKVLRVEFPDSLPPFELLWWGDFLLMVVVITGLLNWYRQYYKISGLTHTKDRHDSNED